MRCNRPQSPMSEKALPFSTGEETPDVRKDIGGFSKESRKTAIAMRRSWVSVRALPALRIKDSSFKRSGIDRCHRERQSIAFRAIQVVPFGHPCYYRTEKGFCQEWCQEIFCGVSGQSSRPITSMEWCMWMAMACSAPRESRFRKKSMMRAWSRRVSSAS